MEGPADNRGVNLRALQTVMELSASTAEDFSSVVHVSMLEVYNEKIRSAACLPAACLPDNPNNPLILCILQSLFFCLLLWLFPCVLSSTCA